MIKLSTICFGTAMLGIFLRTASSNAMKRLVYNRSGKTLRPFSRRLLYEYHDLYGKDENYWVYRLSFFAFLLGMIGFMLFPK